MEHGSIPTEWTVSVIVSKRNFPRFTFSTCEGMCVLAAFCVKKKLVMFFDSGSRTPISITLLAKKPGYTGKAVINYCCIGDYLNRNEKLAEIRNLRDVSNPEMNWTVLTPNEHNDWLNQRNNIFENFLPLIPDNKFDSKTKSFFTTYSLGLASGRDSWVYGFSNNKLRQNVSRD